MVILDKYYRGISGKAPGGGAFFFNSLISAPKIFEFWSNLWIREQIFQYPPGKYSNFIRGFVGYLIEKVCSMKYYEPLLMTGKYLSIQTR